MLIIRPVKVSFMRKIYSSIFIHNNYYLYNLFFLFFFIYYVYPIFDLVISQYNYEYPILSLDKHTQYSARLLDISIRMMDIHNFIYLDIQYSVGYPNGILCISINGL